MQRFANIFSLFGGLLRKSNSRVTQNQLHFAFPVLELGGKCFGGVRGNVGFDNKHKKVLPPQDAIYKLCGLLCITCRE